MSISAKTLQFLSELKKNNNKDWFTTNKKRYESARQEFIQFVDALIKEIGTFDQSVQHLQAKNCVFRIYRDVRFSKDKAPYKPNFGANICAVTSRSELHRRAGYYVHLEPGASMLAGGAYLPEGDWLKGIRQEIDYNGERLKAILNGPEFKKYFGGLTGDKLKTTPKGYTSDHPDIELLRHKSFLAVHTPTDKQIQSTDFLSYCSSVFRVLQPFDQFLNEAAGH